eukprot:TRINITY_DN33744_c0_g1_i1.p2 TRINITY_DN33744_c0_g1~~TRINITY_DN33744_c0_g1_i1.p2  ORF type:complete len:234 (+),score=64.08 TRINITY_DN33744_c0_g1_i1:45-746(+)
MFTFNKPEAMSVGEDGRSRASKRGRRLGQDGGAKEDIDRTPKEQQQTERLLNLVAKLALSSALQVRVLRSIMLDIYLLPEDHRIVGAIKAATTEYANQVEGISKQKRTEVLGLPHLHAWNAFLNAVKGLCKVQEVATALVAYEQQVVGQVSSSNLWTVLHAHVRYCRVQKCWAAKLKRLEINVVIGTPAATLWDVLKKHMGTLGLQERRGMAPPGNLEEQVQRMLDSAKEDDL